MLANQRVHVLGGLRQALTQAVDLEVTSVALSRQGGGRRLGGNRSARGLEQNEQAALRRRASLDRHDLDVDALQALAVAHLKTGLAHPGVATASVCNGLA